MAGPYMIVSTVHTGSAVDDVCRYLCGEREIASPVVAMDPSGVLVIGEMVGCPGCGDRWICAFCPAVLPFDGRAAHQHMIARHAA